MRMDRQDHTGGSAMSRPARLLLAALLAMPFYSSGQDAPLAKGQAKFLGSIHSPSQIEGFERYWNKLTPENAGKWGEVEAVRGVMDWRALDAAHAFAKKHGFPLQMHVMVWGNQQPEWLKHLPPDEQRMAIERWFAAVAARYPDLEFVEVVNEPLNDPPNKDDEGGGNYVEALGGAGATGWDWIVTSYRMARRHFPHARLLINDYNIVNKPENARRYREIIDLLHGQQLLDGVGVQAHAFSTGPDVPVETIKANLDLLAGAGLPLYVTEMDIDGPTDDAQLASYRRVFPLFWEHPAVKGVTLWGFRPGLWRQKEGAYLIRADGSERPALTWLRDYMRRHPAIAEPMP